jgi:quinol monooxygenase YgiN
MSAQLTLIAHLFAKPDKAEEAKALLSSLVGTTRTEKGCVDYHLHQSTADPTEFVFYESWATQEDLDRHMETPNLRNLASRSAELFREEPTIGFMTMISERN